MNLGEPFKTVFITTEQGKMVFLILLFMIPSVMTPRMAFTFQHFASSATCIHFLICGSPQILLLTELFPVFYKEIIFSSLTIETHASSDSIIPS